MGRRRQAAARNGSAERAEGGRVIGTEGAGGAACRSAAEGVTGDRVWGKNGGARPRTADRKSASFTAAAAAPATLEIVRVSGVLGTLAPTPGAPTASASPATIPRAIPGPHGACRAGGLVPGDRGRLRDGGGVMVWGGGDPAHARVARGEDGSGQVHGVVVLVPHEGENLIAGGEEDPRLVDGRAEARDPVRGVRGVEQFAADCCLQFEEAVFDGAQPGRRLLEDDGLVGVAPAPAGQVFTPRKVGGEVGCGGVEGGRVVPVGTRRSGGGGDVALAAGAAVVDTRRLLLQKPVANRVESRDGRGVSSGVVSPPARAASGAIEGARADEGVTDAGAAPVAVADTVGYGRLPKMVAGRRSPGPPGPSAMA